MLVDPRERPLSRSWLFNQPHTNERIIHCLSALLWTHKTAPVQSIRGLASVTFSLTSHAHLPDNDSRHSLYYIPDLKIVVYTRPWIGPRGHGEYALIELKTQNEPSILPLCILASCLCLAVPCLVNHIGAMPSQLGKFKVCIRVSGSSPILK